MRRYAGLVAAACRHGKPGVSRPGRGCCRGVAGLAPEAGERGEQVVGEAALLHVLGNVHAPPSSSSFCRSSISSGGSLTSRLRCRQNIHISIEPNINGCSSESESSALGLAIFPAVIWAVELYDVVIGINFGVVVNAMFVGQLFIGGIMAPRDITCLIISVTLILLSIQYSRGKWFGSIAGHNALSEEARSNIDIRPYAQRISMSSFSIGVLFLAFAFERWLRKVNTLIFDVILCFLIIFAVIAFLMMVKFIFVRGR